MPVTSKPAPPRKLPSRERKARPGGCGVIAAQRARIAVAKTKTKGSGSAIGAKEIVQGLFIEHGLLAAIMAMGLFAGRAAGAVVSAVVGMLLRSSTSAGPIQSVASGGVTNPLATLVAEPRPRGRTSRRLPVASPAGGGGGGVTPAMEPESTAEASASPRSQAIRTARQDSMATWGHERGFEFIAQALQNDGWPPMDRYDRTIRTKIAAATPELGRFLSPSQHDPHSPAFKNAKDLFNAAKRANPGMHDEVLARAIYGDLTEIARAVEAARYADPTMTGPTNSGPENDGDGGEGSGRRPRSPNDEPPPPAPSPFKF